MKEVLEQIGWTLNALSYKNMAIPLPRKKIGAWTMKVRKKIELKVDPIKDLGWQLVKHKGCDDRFRLRVLRDEVTRTALSQLDRIPVEEPPRILATHNPIRPYLTAKAVIRNNYFQDVFCSDAKAWCFIPYLNKRLELGI